MNIARRAKSFMLKIIPFVLSFHFITLSEIRLDRRLLTKIIINEKVQYKMGNTLIHHDDH